MANKLSYLLKLIALSSFILFSVAAHSSTRIIGGNDARPSDYPWMASLQVKESDANFCGGTLIAEKWVLSAAHCFNSRHYQNVDVVIGEHDLSTPDEISQTFDIIKTYKLPGVDIILLELSGPADIEPISLADRLLLQDLEVGQQLTLIGWGNQQPDKNNEPELPSILQEVNIPIYDQSECESIWQEVSISSGFITPFEGVNGNTICTGHVEGLLGSCHGDSGGPLIDQIGGTWYQFGISSLTPNPCNSDEVPDVFTSVAALRTFINDTIIPGDEDTLSLLPISDVIQGQGLMYNHRLYFVNDAIDDINIEKISFAEFDEGFQRSTGSSHNSCDNRTLAPSESCFLDISASFNSVGTNNLKLVADISGFDEVLTFDLDIQSIQEAAFSNSIGEGIYFYTRSDDEWEHVIGSTAELIVDIETHETATLLGNVQGPGHLSFEWKVERPERTVLLLYINGLLTSTYPQNTATGYIEYSEYLSEDDGYDIEWRVTRPFGFDGDDLGGASYARLKSLSFDADPVPEEKKKSSGGGGIDYFLFLFLLMLSSVSIFKVSKKTV